MTSLLEAELVEGEVRLAEDIVCVNMISSSGLLEMQAVV